MTKVQNLRSLREKAVARGKRPAHADAGMASVGSVQALVRLLTPETGSSSRGFVIAGRDRSPSSPLAAVRAARAQIDGPPALAGRGGWAYVRGGRS